MANYRLQIKPSAAKEIEGVPLKDRRRIVRRIAALAKHPRPSGCEKLSGQDKYRVRQGDYRILFTVSDEELTVVVVKIGHRRDVYR
ncbi:MAG: type II toxin-antitoxin system RelE/ParE family toxin [Gemmatimonadales bacterium]